MPSHNSPSPIISTASTPHYTPSPSEVLPIPTEYNQQLEEDPLDLLKQLLAEDVDIPSGSGVAPAPPPRCPISEVLSEFRTCVRVENRSFISLLSDNPDLATCVHDLSQELNSRNAEVPEEILRTLFGQGLNALTKCIQVVEKLATAKKLDQENKAARTAFLAKTRELDFAIVVGQAKMADLYAQIQQLEAQLNTLRTRRDALEATTDKLVDT